MKSLELVEIIESVLKWEDISQKIYDKWKSIIESILVNHNIKLLDSWEVFNQLLIKLFDKKDWYNFDMNIYQKRNYIIKYLTKAMQEIVQISHNIVDIPLYIIEKWTQYVDEVYEPYPEKHFSEDFHEVIEKELLTEWLKDIINPKEKYILQRIFIDWVKKKDVAKELKIKPKQISYMLNKIKNKAATAFANKY